MFENANNIPQDYIPFEELVICSNSIINGMYLFEVNNHVPLFVGKNSMPLIWLHVPLNAELEAWEEVISKNVVVNRRRFKNFLIEILQKEEDGSVNVRMVDRVVIDVQKVSEKKAIIKKLDLRLLGLNIFGNEEGLHVGGQNFVRNTFTNIQTMIAVGNK